MNVTEKKGRTVGADDDPNSMTWALVAVTSAISCRPLVRSKPPASRSGATPHSERTDCEPRHGSSLVRDHTRSRRGVFRPRVGCPPARVRHKTTLSSGERCTRSPGPPWRRQDCPPLPHGSCSTVRKTDSDDEGVEVNSKGCWNLGFLRYSDTIRVKEFGLHTGLLSIAKSQIRIR